jgi:predicted XRE-type DNA-binding protein
MSDVVRHQNSKLTVDALIDMVVRTGQPLRISL